MYLNSTIYGLVHIHNMDIVHRDIHSGNILICGHNGLTDICDLGLSKSATESTNDNEVYGIIPYMAPEILRRQM